MREGFVHLDVRSFFSLKDGAFSPEELAVRAAELGFRSVALTDRDGLYGATRFVDACAKVGVRSILGATVTIDGGGSVVLLATDATGYANLCRLLTDAHMLGERGEPSLGVEQVCAHAAGLVAIAGPASVPGALAVAGMPGAAALAIASLREAFGDRLSIGIQHRLEARSNDEIRALLRLAERVGVRAVATNPVRYLVPEDAFLADALECMREIVPINRHNVSRVNAEGWLKPAETMRRLFVERPDLCDATLAIEEMCGFDLGLRTVHLPEFSTPSGRSASSVLAERCWRGIERRGLAPTHHIRDRLDHELDMIHKLGYSAYFLTVADIVEDIRAMGIRCACRGSAAGSFVCYLTGISDVDPVRHDLVFERFLNPLRDELPDIDIDLPSPRRGPRGRQGARPARGRGRHGRQGVPAHRRAPHQPGDPGAARARGIQPERRPARAPVPRGRTTERVPAAPGAASERDRPVERRPGGARAARAVVPGLPDDPGRQGRRRAPRLSEARRPRRADALRDAPLPRRDRTHARREDRPGPDPGR
jgi:error-prone DNA polymerase